MAKKKSSPVSAELEVLRKEIGRDNVLSLPRMTKITLNVGMGSWLHGAKDFAPVVKGIEAISGQKPVVKKARMSVSNFKLRKGMPVGVMVTLRGKKMHDFLTRFIEIAAPRIRDFSGLSARSFDGSGNYSFGVKEYAVFPEIHYDDVVKNYGIQVTISTTATNDEEAKILLGAYGFPFQRTPS
ncbi:MAG: 50S ribosomal protein L5 [Candidatus Peregrinibacteria bacterium]